MLLYFLERAKRVAGDDEPVEIVCEIVSKERTKVRALSGDSYQFNQGLPAKAVRAHVESIRHGRWMGQGRLQRLPGRRAREADARALPVASDRRWRRRGLFRQEPGRLSWRAG